jgi:hypothetical protein
MKGKRQFFSEFLRPLGRQLMKMLKLLGRPFSFTPRALPPVVRDSKNRPIINPKRTSPPLQVIKPRLYSSTRAEALAAVIRKYDYPNPRPPRADNATGGER